MTVSVKKIKTAALFIPALFIILLGAGCTKQQDTTTATTETTSTNAAVETTTDTIDLSQVPDLFEEPIKPNPLALTATDVVVTVDGKDITHGEIMKSVQMYMQRYASQVPPQQLASMQKQLYGTTKESLIAQILLDEAAEKSGLVVSDDELAQEIEKTRANIPEGENLEDLLSQSGIDFDEWKENLRKRILVGKLAEEKTANTEETTLAEIAEFYKSNQSEFEVPETVSASHILLGFTKDDTDETKAAKKQQLLDIKKQIDNGASFEEMAKKYSTCPSSKNGGSLGTFPRGQMVPEFEEAAFSLKPGEISDVVETQFGYHLIKVTDHQEAKTRSLKEVQENLKAYLDNQKKQKALADYVETLRDKATIVNHKQDLDAGTTTE